MTSCRKFWSSVAGDSDSSKSLAESVRDGAAAVRFTEVDVRAVGIAANAADLRDYDGIVVVGSGREVSPALASVDRAASTWPTRPRSANTVFGLGGIRRRRILERLARLGGIIVTSGRASSRRTLGQR